MNLSDISVYPSTPSKCPVTDIPSSTPRNRPQPLPHTEDSNSDLELIKLGDTAAAASAALSGQCSYSYSSVPFGGEGKVVLDRVYEHVTLPSIAVAIIDTPEFQRLRGLKQLGFTSWLYPGATHTRFEHSIGVAHLANTMVKEMARRQPELGVTEADVLVVTVAGLCHDIGHGPFSHLFEVIVNKVRKERKQPKFHHEAMSTALLERVLQRLDLATYGLDERDAFMMKLCIKGLEPGTPWPEEATGRGAQKRFLVEIVSNKRNGVDVDKLDYFMRDSLCCYGRATVDCHIPRLISACRALQHNGEYQLCFEEKLAQSLMDIFTLRAKMHKYAYQHRIIRVIDKMVTDILSLADPFLTVRGTDNVPRRVSECVEDEEAYVRLGDWIINAIEASEKEEMRPAQAIISRLNTRDFYTVAGHATMRDYLDFVDEAEVRAGVLSIIARRIRENGGCVKGLWDSGEEEGGPPRRGRSSQRSGGGATPLLGRGTCAFQPTCGEGGSAPVTTPSVAASKNKGEGVPSLQLGIPAAPACSLSSDEDLSERAKTFLKEAAESLIVDFVKIHYGSTDSEDKPDDPISHITFFNPKEAVGRGGGGGGAQLRGFTLPKDHKSHLFSPTRYGEKSIVIITREHCFKKAIGEAFEEWRDAVPNCHRFIATVPVYNNTSYTPQKKRAREEEEP